MKKTLFVGCLSFVACGIGTLDRNSDSPARNTDSGASRPGDSSVRSDTGVSSGSDTGVSSGSDTGVSSGSDTGVSSGSDTGVSSGSDTGVSDTGVPDAYVPPVGTDPRDSATVYWVGHSLISHREGETQPLFELIGQFARSQGHAYGFYQHTTPGAPLSWNWNMEAEKRAEIERRGSRYDVMVITEGISLDQTIEGHSSAFYAQRFYCAMMNANPNAEVFLYESWHHLYASDRELGYPEPHVFDWRARLDEDRPRWESVADDAMRSDLPPPRGGYYDAAHCTPSSERPIRIIPVGSALAELYDRLERPRSGEDWEGFSIHDFVVNGYRDWPEEWPVDPPGHGVDWRRRIASLTLKRPRQEPDDIHPSPHGVYFVTLVHYATIYRRSPIGLPAANGVSRNLARLMQELVWEIVTRDPRTGVTSS